MVEPVTTAALAVAGLGWIANGIASGVVGSASDRLLSSHVRNLKTRFAGMRDLPENEHVAKSIRAAQMQALEQVVRKYRDIGKPEWEEQDYERPEVFFQRALFFCATTIGRCRDPSIKLNLNVTPVLGAAIDNLLSPTEHDGPAAERAAAKVGPPKTQKKKSARFIETARELGVGEDIKEFEAVFNKVALNQNSGK